MFSECISLKEFNFPDFNPVNINTNNMFYAITFELSEKQAREREHTRSLFVAEDIKAGEIFTPANMRSVRPGLENLCE